MAICVGRNAIDGTYVIAERQDPPRAWSRRAERSTRGGAHARGNPLVAGVRSEVQVGLTGSQ